MHCPSGHLLPGPKFIPELLPPHSEPFANTCHPLSITKTPVTRWPGCPQGATTAATLLPCQPLVQQCLLLCPPQEPCETTRLLPIVRGSGVTQTLRESPQGVKKRVARSLPPCAPRCPEPGRLRFPPCGIRGSSASCRGRCRSHKVAECPRSCSEVTGGYRGVTECRQSCPEVTGGYRGVTECRWTCPEVTGGYSLPLRGVTECPPQRHSSFLQEYLEHRCSKGYPTQEFGGCYSSEQRLSSVGGVVKGSEECPQLRGVTKECPQLRGVTKVTKECPPLRAVTKECPQIRGVTKVTKECPQLRTKLTKEYPPLRAVTKECPQIRGVTKVTKECPQIRGVTKMTKECPPLRAVTKVTKECPQLRAVTKGSALLEGTKGRSCSAPQLSRCRCPQHPRGPPRPSRLTSAGVKRSGHPKKSRCASKWLW